MKKTLLSLACLSVISITQKLKAQPSFNPAANFTSGSYPFSINSGDINGDGFPDITCANYSSDNISVFIGNGAGGFGTAATYGAGSNPDGILVSDVNTDGINDIIVTNSSSNNISVLLGNGLGSFSAAINYATGTGPQSCVTGDFDGDGKIDIAAASRNSSSVSILLGDGLGAFAAPVSYGVGPAPSEITSADFNGDGNIDLATANNSSNTISVLLADGLGSFSAASNFAVQANSFSLHAADLNNDGKIDIATANPNSDDISVLLGDGLGSFSTAVNYSTGGSTPYSVRSADFNNDGMIDLVTANNGGSNVSVLLGNGSGAFTSSGNYGVGQSPVSITTSDFNKDGRQDAAVVNSFANTISVLMNVSVGPASTLNFDGSNDYIFSPDQAALDFGTDDFTIEANFKSSVSQPNYAGIVAKASSGTNIGFQLVLVNDRIAAEFSDGSTSFGTAQGLQGNTILTDGSWHHVAMVVTRSLNQIQLLVDGNIEATVINPAIATLNINDPSPLMIGVERTNSAYINGSLDEVRLWNVARTRCELFSYKNCEIPTTASGLVANYHFNQGIDMMSNPLITALTDASGNAIHGTLSGFALNGSSSNWLSPGVVVSGFSTPVTCPLASALNFDGSDDKVYIGSSLSTVLDPLNAITVEAWVNSSTTSGLGVIVGNYATYNNDMQFLLRRDFDEYAFWVSDGTGFKVVNSGSLTVIPNTWQHVAGVWNGSDLKIYIDGILKATTTGVTGTDFQSVSNPVIIGYNNISENFSGSIDEVRLWTVARSRCEINTYKNCEMPTSSTNLLANYHFNQGIASYSNSGENVLSDVSGNGYNGTLNGFSLSGTTSNWVSPGGVVNNYTTALTPPIVTATSGTVCAGQPFTIIPGGAVTYTFSNGSNVYIPTVGASYTVTSHSVAGTDANDCVGYAIFFVTANNPPVISATTNNTLLCAGETATLSVTGATSYTWSTSETASDIAITPTTQTTYTVEGTDNNSCSNTTTITQDVSLCTGIVGIVNNNDLIRVYPNPSKGLFVVYLTTSSKVIVTNALGQIIISETMEAGKHDVNILDQSAGIYFVKITQNNKQQVIKIIKE